MLHFDKREKLVLKYGKVYRNTETEEWVFTMDNNVLVYEEYAELIKQVSTILLFGGKGLQDVIDWNIAVVSGDVADKAKEGDDGELFITLDNGAVIFYQTEKYSSGAYDETVYLLLSTNGEGVFLENEMIFLFEGEMDDEQRKETFTKDAELYRKVFKKIKEAKKIRKID